MNVEINSGITLKMIQSKKFKDICLSINFFSENNEQNATERALLSMVLSDRCAKYDTKKKMSGVCDHLYGCTLGSRVVTYGKAHCLEIRSRVINPSYVHENNHLFNDWLELIHEVIFNPCMIHDELSKDLVEENKRILMSKILRREDDAQSVVIEKCFELAGEDQPLGVKPRGNKEILEKLTNLDITRQYHAMMNHDQIEILVCGDFDEMALSKMIQKQFNFKERKPILENAYCLKSDTEYEKREVRNIPQSNIALVLSTDISVLDRNYPALKVANGILGQLPSSYLFQVIREQHSLCYSIYSSLISYDGACLITTGIEKYNIEKTLKLIDEQIERCQSGDFSDELLNTTKQMLANSLRSSLDNMTSIVSYNLSNLILNREYSVEQNIEDILNVTFEECVEVFKKMKKIATYVLVSRENDDE